MVLPSLHHTPMLRHVCAQNMLWKMLSDPQEVKAELGRGLPRIPSLKSAQAHIQHLPSPGDSWVSIS